jgi:hypothetical protein
MLCSGGKNACLIAAGIEGQQDLNIVWSLEVELP